MSRSNKGSDSYDLKKVLNHLGLPEDEKVDAKNYDGLLPTHSSYGKDQTVKLYSLTHSALKVAELFQSSSGPTQRS